MYKNDYISKLTNSNIKATNFILSNFESKKLTDRIEEYGKQHEIHENKKELQLYQFKNSQARDPTRDDICEVPEFEGPHKTYTNDILRPNMFMTNRNPYSKRKQMSNNVKLLPGSESLKSRKFGAYSVKQSYKSKHNNKLRFQLKYCSN